VERALYISYFGLREPLVQTQVLPYLRALAAGGTTIFLLTFEPERRKRWDSASLAQTREQLRAEGIERVASAYHKRPSLPATLFDVAAGALRTIALVRKHGIGIIHARSHVPALMGAIARRFTRAKLLFDIRGLMADEYADSGHWRAGGLLYRLTKRVESFLFRSADAFVILTERARRELFATETRPVEVIPTCIDPARFAGVVRASGARTTIVYAGSLGGAYLVKELSDFFAVAKEWDPSVYPMILTHSDPSLLRIEGDHFAGFVDPKELPSFLASADIAISIVKPGYSKIAMSPTKFAEYLAAGLPVISTRGIGDIDAQIERERVGVLLDGFDRDSYRRALDEIRELRRDPSLPERCRALALREYDLHSVGAVRYRRIYARLGER
jgi:glycosyltransferase involved in cell wall biosynthesis